MVLGLRGDEKHTTPLPDSGRAKKWATKKIHDAKTKEIQASSSTSQGILLRNKLNSAQNSNLDLMAPVVWGYPSHWLWQLHLIRALNMGVIVFNCQGECFRFLGRAKKTRPQLSDVATADSVQYLLNFQGFLSCSCDGLRATKILPRPFTVGSPWFKFLIKVLHPVAFPKIMHF